MFMIFLYNIKQTVNIQLIVQNNFVNEAAQNFIFKTYN